LIHGESGLTCLSVWWTFAAVRKHTSSNKQTLSLISRVNYTSFTNFSRKKSFRQKNGGLLLDLRLLVLDLRPRLRQSVASKKERREKKERKKMMWQAGQNHSSTIQAEKKTNATKYFQPKRNHNNFQPHPKEITIIFNPDPTQPNPC
jgi:hypothetical protein